MKIKKILVALLVLLLAGCAASGGHQEKPPAELPAPRVATPAMPGSLWSEGQGSLFVDVKARNLDDIVTVAIFERASASKEAKTSTGRDSSLSADLTRIFGLERNIGNINAAIDPAALLSVGYKNDFAGSGSTSRKEDLVATLTSRVVEVLANGNMRIEGSKTVRVNNENQIIRLSGIIRPADISPRNVVDSQHILDAQIVYTGKGVISDKQGQGWLVRILDNVWPF